MPAIRIAGIAAIMLSVAACSFLYQTQTAPPAVPAGPAPVPVTITVDASKAVGDLNPIWRWCGYDEPNYTYAANGKKLIGQFAGDKNSAFGPAWFRAHSLLVTGDGVGRLKWGSTNAYTEDAAGKPVYDWTIIDRIFDTYIDAGAKPYAQIGFMPKALSLKPEPYEHNWTPGGNASIFTGWTTPPKDYDKWRELCYQWAKHCVERYGMAKVKTWNWEVWNEPNIGYFVASAAGGNKVVDYEKVWDYAADGIRKAIPEAVIGGPETAGEGGAFTRDFIEHCLNGTNYATGQKGSPLGLISFHAKGSPTRNLGHVQMGISNQLNAVNTGFRTVASRPETAKLPVVIGESDPDGCAACQSYKGLYPEYNYRNGSIFAAYTIEQLTRTMDMAQSGKVNLLGAVTWAFEFEDQPIFGGFRALATDGVALPVLNTFRMLNKMGTKRLAVASTGDLGLEAIRTRGVRGAASDVYALAARDERRVTIISWNYHDDDLPGAAADITLNVSGLPAGLAKVKMTEWRCDETHSNAYTVWKGMGSPEKPTVEQHRKLEAASELAVMKPAADQAVSGGAAVVKVNVPRQGVSLVELAW
jgi:xylan 1,4-beta-xylosidase